MPRGGRASRGVTDAASLAMVPSMRGRRRASPGTVSALYGTGPPLAPGRTSDAVEPTEDLELAGRAKQTLVDVQPFHGLRVELTGHRKFLSQLILLERRPRLRTERPVDRPRVITEVAKRTLSLSNERRALALEVSRWGASSHGRLDRIRSAPRLEVIAVTRHAHRRRTPNGSHLMRSLLSALARSMVVMIRCSRRWLSGSSSVNRHADRRPMVASTPIFVSIPTSGPSWDASRSTRWLAACRRSSEGTWTP